MTRRNGSRRTIYVIAFLGMMMLLLCCGLPIGLFDRYALLHIYDYKQLSPASIEGVAVTVDLNPQERIKTPPETLKGPPYALTIMLRDSTRSAVAAKLHSFQMRLDDQSMIDGNISVEQSSWKQGRDFTLLFVQFKTQELGQRPTALADIEIEYPDRRVRQVIEIPMRADHRRTFYVP